MDDEVWVLEKCERYEGGHVLGVYGDRGLAIAALSKEVGHPVDPGDGDTWPRDRDAVEYFQITAWPVVLFESEIYEDDDPGYSTGPLGDGDPGYSTGPG